MNEKINLKLGELIDTIQSDPKIIELKSLKDKIYKDEELKKYLDSFKHISNLPYSNEYVSLKEKIIANTNVSKYKKLENELYFTVLEINKRLNSLVEKGGCNK